MDPQTQTQQPRIVFLDYLRIFACFLVMLVHASENFYGAAGSTDMAGPQSFLANETDRLWVSLYDGFSRMSVPLFIIVSAYLLMPMPAAQTSWQFYRRRAKRILPPFFVFMILYSTLPLLWGQIDTATSTRDLSRLLLNFPTLAGHLWFMYPLISIYLFIPIISPWLERATAREERFFILLFLISTCIPYLHRWCGEVWGECFWNEYHMLWYFSGYLGYSVIAHYIRKHLTWSRRRRFVTGLVLMVAGAVATILSFYVQAVYTIGKANGEMVTITNHEDITDGIDAASAGNCISISGATLTATEGATFDVYTIGGTAVAKGCKGSLTLDGKAGVYVVKVDNGGQVTTHKVVVRPGE